MSRLPLPFAPLVAGKELADLVRLIPGRLASRAFLDKMLRFVDKDLSTKASIKDAINALQNNRGLEIILMRNHIIWELS